MRKKLWTSSTAIPKELLESRPPPRIRSLPPTKMSAVFQPIVDLKTRRLFAAEMLARCYMEELRDPTVLFEQAELQGATGRLGRLTREVGFADAPAVPLFINLHPHELSSRWIVRPDDPMNFVEQGLYLEITESTALDYFDLCQSALRELCQRLRAKLVVDDFGAGYSNLVRIAELRPAIVKLDRSLVMNVHEDRRRLVILKHVISLCEELGARVVAEGLETTDELRAVIDAGAHYGQGYLLARPGNPMPAVTWPR